MAGNIQNTRPLTALCPIMLNAPYISTNVLGPSVNLLALDPLGHAEVVGCPSTTTRLVIVPSLTFLFYDQPKCRSSELRSSLTARQQPQPACHCLPYVLPTQVFLVSTTHVLRSTQSVPSPLIITRVKVGPTQILKMTQVAATQIPPRMLPSQTTPNQVKSRKQSQGTSA